MDKYCINSPWEFILLEFLKDYGENVLPHYNYVIDLPIVSKHFLKFYRE